MPRKHQSAGRIQEYARGKKTKPEGVIEVAGSEPVAERAAGEPTIIVPRAAAQESGNLTIIIPGSGPLPNVAAQIVDAVRRDTRGKLAGDAGGGVFSGIAIGPLCPKGFLYRFSEKGGQVVCFFAIYFTPGSSLKCPSCVHSMAEWTRAAARTRLSAMASFRSSEIWAALKANDSSS